MSELKLRMDGVEIEGFADSSTIRLDPRLPGVPTEALIRPYAIYRFTLPDGDTAWVSLVKVPNEAEKLT